MSNQKVYNFAALTTNPHVKKRVEEICEEFSFTYKIYESIEEMSQEETAQFFIICLDSKSFQKELSGIVQSVKFFNSESFIVTFLHKTMDEEDCEFLKKSGTSMILLDEDLMNSSKVEFLALQVIKASYIPIKPTDLVSQRKISFDIYHIMPSNQKYLRILQSGDTLTEKKKNHLISHTKELYIKRGAAFAYSEYMNANHDASKDGVDCRSRAFFITLQSYFIDLVILLCDRSPNNSFSQGKELLQKCQGMCSKLLNCLAAAESPWNIVNNSVEGDFGSLERTPSQVATVGIIGMNSGFSNIDDIMLATLINNLGLLNLPYSVCKLIKKNKENEIKGELRKSFENHPSASINLVLEKKLPLDEEIKDIILRTHENIDKSGFPNKCFGDKIPLESQLIHFNEKLDQICLIRMGECKKDFTQELARLIDYEYRLKTFSPFFLQKVKLH